MSELGTKMDNQDTQRLLGELHANSKYTTEKIEAMEDRMVAMETKVTSLYNELSLYKTSIKVVRAVLVTIVFILGFKFGDIATYWHNLFDGQ